MDRRNAALPALMILASLVLPATAGERVNRGLVEVITGSVDGSAARMAEDLADLLDDGATRRVLPVIGKGSAQDLVDLRSLRGIDFAVVQTDVLDDAKTQGLLPGGEAGLTYVAKLWSEEFHLLVRADIHNVGDLAGQKVNFGGQGDGTAVTALRLFQRLGIKVEATGFGQALALEKLRTGEIAGFAFVTGKPAPLFAGPRVPQGLHFLAIPLRPDIAASYSPARLTAEDYPGIVPPDHAVDTVAIGTVMLVANLTPGSERYRNAANFVDAFFTQFPKLLEAPHHPKWAEVNLAAELPGWKRFAPADAWIKRNGATPVAMSEDQLRDIFVKFLDERSKVGGGATLSGDQKDQLFAQFKRWQGAH